MKLDDGKIIIPFTRKTIFPLKENIHFQFVHDLDYFYVNNIMLFVNVVKYEEVDIEHTKDKIYGIFTIHIEYNGIYYEFISDVQEMFLQPPISHNVCYSIVNTFIPVMIEKDKYGDIVISGRKCEKYLNEINTK